MYSPTSNNDIYTLITQLCENLLENEKRRVDNYHYLPRTVNRNKLKQCRTKCFEILLKKSALAANDYSDYDPIPELLKHAYVLRTANGQLSQAKELEDCLTDLSNDDLDIKDSTVSSMLIFLNEIKSCYQNAEQSLDIFNYGKPSSCLPEVGYDASPMFQMYPVESFHLSDNLEMALCPNNNPSFTSVISGGPSPLSHFIFQPMAINSAESVKDENFLTLPLPSPISLNLNFSDEYSLGSYMLPNEVNGFTRNQEGIVTEPESPWQCPESPNIEIESVFEICGAQTPSDNVLKESNKCVPFNWDAILKEPEFLNRCSWETLGNYNLSKEPLFVTDLYSSVMYLEKLKHPAMIPLLSKKTINSIELVKQVEISDILKSMKLLLLGIESEHFFCGSLGSFQVKKNLVVSGIGADALENVCLQVIQWGNCYKYLSTFVAPNQSQELQVNGLIFKALRNSINEFLLFWKSAIQCLKVHENSMGLLRFIDSVQPLANLITEIAKLCKNNERDETPLGEGIGILTHVYEKATLITKPKVALIFYSILHSCCEVYFRLLQQWIFEGTCEDIYDEFMIQVRTKYLRMRAHRFWTRAFSINHKSVPGFLGELAQSILECGKSVRLLKICDPRNPICHLSNLHQPSIRVCLSVEMEREQIEYFEKYIEQGQIALGEIVTFASAIRARKSQEKGQGELVIKAQRETLERIKREIVEAAKRKAEEKSALFAMFKNQAEESALRKEQAIKAEIEADKVFLKTMAESAKRAEDVEQIEKTKSLEYYNELAAEAEIRRSRAKWKIERMRLFDERILALSSFKNLNSEEKIEARQSQSMDENRNLADEDDITAVDGNKNADESVIDPCHSQSIDENRNTTEEEIVAIDENENTDTVTNVVSSSQDVKLIRPMSLDLDNRIVVDNMTAAQRNKMRVLQEEFNFSSNNNNTGFLSNVKTGNLDSLKSEQLKEIQRNRTKNTMHHMDYNWETSSVQRKPLFNSAIAQQNRDKIMAHQSIGMESANSERFFDPDKLVKNLLLPSFDNVLAFPFCESSEPPATELETPMSCTTDNFTYSVGSTPSSPVTEANTPFLEIDGLEKSITSSENQEQIRLLKGPLDDRNFMGLGPNLASSIFGLTLTTRDVDMINSTSLQEHLKKSVMIPLRAQSQLVNNAIIKYFLQEHHLLTHLHNLRSYYFLLNGEFANSLTHSLFKRLYELPSPSDFFNPAMLKHILTKAVISSLSNSYKDVGLLNLYAVDIPSQLQISNPEALNYLSLNYKISWPLNIIFDDALMEQYNKIFKFLLMVSRVLWVLQEDFHILKREKSAVFSTQLHRIQLYRHSMLQFANALHTYLTCSVLHDSWTEFEKELEHVTTLDQFYTTQLSYMKKILSRCMLTQRGETMRTYICNIFNMILKFHNRCRWHKWVFQGSERVHPNYERLDEIYKSFCEQRDYLTHMAEKLATSGYQPHLTHLLHALNINNSFKPSTSKHGLKSRK